MSRSELEQLRLSLLRFLEANVTRYALPTAVLRQMARAEGSQVSAEEVEAELRYLEDGDLVTVNSKMVSPEIRAWRITKAGRDFYAQQMA